MRYSLCLLLLYLWVSPVFGQVYEEELADSLVETALVENMVMETGPASLVVDVTRTKIGRDFYESFYQQWSNVSVAMPRPAADDSTSKGLPASAIFNPSEYVITIEDLPLPGNGFTSNVSILVDDQIIWQQFIPARRDVIEEFSAYAVAVIQAYFAEMQSVQTQLGNEDQRGTGVY